MTVAAIILATSPESATADVEGVARVRRLVDTAWAGGAIPIVVVAADPDGAVAKALAGAPVTLAGPAPIETGSVGQMLRGIEVASGEVGGTDAVLLWPARFQWVGPETVTTLIELHGRDPAALLRPTYEGTAGWPALMPLTALVTLRRVAADRLPDAILDELVAVVGARALDLGDPGTVHDADTPRSALPPYLGPSRPAASHDHEWGAAVAEERDDAPLGGPALAPYPQAADADGD